LEIESFFIFYETRCPQGELHDWVAGDGGGVRCARCELDAALVRDEGAGRAASRPAAAKAYYRRWLAAYRRDLAVTMAAAAPAPPRAAADLAPAARAAIEAARAWRSDYGRIVRAATLAGVTPATIEAIGGMEGREWDDIVEGRALPPPPASPTDPRIHGADAEVRLFLSDYSRLRHGGRATRGGSPSPPLPPELAALLERVPRAELSGLAAALPEVGVGYTARFEAVAKIRTPAETLAFAIQSLCEMVATLTDYTAPAAAPWVKELAGAFAKHEITLIMRNQRLFAKPGRFNWAVFEGDDTEDIPEQVGDVGEDVLDEILTADTEEAPNDPFSGENMDYDTSEDNPNNEPD
jgi:hypothetical protein